jgi:hypothetical protein
MSPGKKVAKAEVGEVSAAALEHETRADASRDLVRLALDKGVDVEVLERLVALEERATARFARQAYFAALAGFQAEVPPIRKTQAVRFDERPGAKIAYYYARLSDIEKVVRPIALNWGLSWSFDSEYDEGELRVTCKVVHIDGHEETASFAAPSAKQAKMNVIQAAGSTRSYAKRYALIDALGLSIAEDDDDGRASGAEGSTEPITTSQLADLTALIQEVGADKEKFYAWLRVDMLADLPQDRYDEARDALERKR